MERFIHQKNLERFRKQLAETTDEQQRARLLQLIEEEEAKDRLPREAR